MKTRTYLLALMVIALIFNGLAQTETNVEALLQLSDEFSTEWEEQQERVKEFAGKNNLPIQGTTESGVTYVMVDVRNGKPLYMATDNLGAAHTTRAFEVWEGGNAGLSLSADDYDNLGQWDGGRVRSTHQEFTNEGTSRVTNMDNTSSINFHATHVAGTMVAGGVVEDAKGMSFEAKLKAWYFDNDVAEMSSASSSGLELSNHSYGIPGGWYDPSGTGNYVWYGDESISEEEDYRFGFYELKSRQADLVAYNAPNYLIVTSAGNQRGDGPSNAGTGGNPPVNGGEDGFDCIAGHFGIAKNTLTVGAVYEVMNYTGPGSVNMSSFSSWGPADDGRIKPDVVGKGVNVYSTLETSNTAYGGMSGTSMSTPNVTGTLALLQSYYQDLNGGTPMRAATLKGLVIHTADEAGPDPGPDYMFGWGLVNAEKAAHIITDNQGQNVLDELVLEENDSYTREVTVPEATLELRVTLSWTDPAGLPTTAQLDPLDPMLVNDLDLRITGPDNTEYYPYKLDPLNPSAAATNDSKNYVDNVELVLINQPAAGTYTIHVEHEGALFSDEQAYSLIISGIDEYEVLPECTSTLIAPGNGDENVLVGEYINWMAAPFASAYDVYFGTDGNGTTTPTNVYNGQSFPTNGFSYVMELNTTYYLQVVPKNNFGSAEGCEEIWSFTTMDAISAFPYLQDMEGAITPAAPEFWQTLTLSDVGWASTTVTAHGGNKSMGCYNQEGLIETPMDSWFISPPLVLEGGKNYPLTFYYRSFIGSHPESLEVFSGSTPDPADLTNVVFEAIDFTGSGWLEAQTNIGAYQDGVMFVGWHAASPAGYGIFVDDITIDSGITTGIEPSAGAEVRIYNTGSGIRIEAGEQWHGADLQVMNLMGQVIHKGRYDHAGIYNISPSNQAGMYFVTLQKNGEAFTKKLILSAN